jgi:hypothetical protein
MEVGPQGLAYVAGKERAEFPWAEVARALVIEPVRRVRPGTRRRQRGPLTYSLKMRGYPVMYVAALAWYERLLGRPPTFVANDTEAVWELAEHRSLAIEHLPEHAGHAMHTIFVDDFDALARIAERGLQPTKRETYANGVQGHLPRPRWKRGPGQATTACAAPTCSRSSSLATPVPSASSSPNTGQPCTRRTA